MRRSQVSFLLTIAATVLLLFGSASGWLLAGWIAHGQPATAGWILGLALFTLCIVGTLFWLKRFVDLYFFRINTFVNEAELILESNPNRRLTPTGPAAIQRLMLLLNRYADRVQSLTDERDREIEQERADLEVERNRLATLMADLSDGVVVCNRDGRILLYNDQARYLLAPTNSPTHTATDFPSEAPNAAGGYIGLGRSIFGLLDRGALTYGINHLRSLHAAEAADEKTEARRPSELSLMTTAGGGGLLRTQMRALTTATGTFNGFVLTLHDMTARVAASSRRDQLLQQLTERMRGGLGNIRAAIEMLHAYPRMLPEQIARFQGVIGEEVTTLSSDLDQTMRTFAADLRAQWRFETMAGSDLLWAIQQYLGEQLGDRVTVRWRAAENASPLWLRVDSYAVVHALSTAIELLHQRLQTTAVDLDLHPLQAPAGVKPVESSGESAITGHRFATLDVHWSSAGIEAGAWLAWKEQVTTVDAGDAMLSLREVAEAHGGEVWFQHDPATAQNYFRLLLPLAEIIPGTLSTQPAQPTIAARPRTYDFDLFDQPALDRTLTSHTLDSLTYTVFDTETTGLDPQRDEIVAIGAARIVNGRLLRQEVFDQLIDPQRTIPHSATAIHGIDNKMVQGQPPITAVLPQFARFAEETVLLGHNLAFDLRMFAGKAEITEIHFNQPVLDTLLLSEVLHPDEQDHALESIAGRLGVDVIGRHTALGDALVTGEVFLHMLPLLRAKGLTTLDELLAASKQTYMAKLTY